MRRKTTTGPPAGRDDGPGYKFDEATREAILRNIEAGAFIRVAAGAAGIDRSTFYEWMADRRPEYRAFQRQVELAQGRARFKAETAVHKDNPLGWLRTGPGRSKPDDEGWTEGYDDLAHRPNPVDAYLRTLTPEEIGGLMYALVTHQLESGNPEVVAEYAHVVQDQEELDRLSALEGLDDDEDDDTEEED